jgi:hypothetical protein
VLLGIVATIKPLLLGRGFVAHVHGGDGFAGLS